MDWSAADMGTPNSGDDMHSCGECGSAAERQQPQLVSLSISVNDRQKYAGNKRRFCDVDAPETSTAR